MLIHALVSDTRVVGVEVIEREGEVVVRCEFRDTLSQRCYVQLASSEVEGGFLQGGCVEGDGALRFPGLLPATYTVLVYGVPGGGGGEESCSPAPGDPDYISVATVYGPRPSTVPTQPSVTDSTLVLHTRFIYQRCVHIGSLVIPKSSNPWCAEGKLSALVTCLH